MDVYKPSDGCGCGFPCRLVKGGDEEGAAVSLLAIESKLPYLHRLVALIVMTANVLQPNQILSHSQILIVNYISLHEFSTAIC